MYAVFVFETKDFIEETKHLFSDRNRIETWVPAPKMREWYDWMFGFILSKELSLPIVQPYITDFLSITTCKNIYRAEEVSIRRAFHSVISSEELLKIPTYGELQYLFNGKQLFIFTCSQV